LISVNIEIIGTGDKETKGLSDFIRSAWEEAGLESLGWTGASEEIIRDLASGKYLREVLSDPKMKIFLGEENGKEVGFAVDRV
jgi:hypothetical protein